MDLNNSEVGPKIAHDIIVLGASAGGVDALTRLVRLLPEDLPAAVFVVVHIPARTTSMLPRIFSRSGPLPAFHPDDGAPIGHGRIYVAPPDYHLLIKPGYVHLAHGPCENGHRPAVDPLFRTAALVYGRRVVGVILSGSLDDGAAGLAAVKKRGGVAIVQSPDEALYPSMPKNAMEAVEVDRVLPVTGIAPLLVKLATDPDGLGKEEGRVPDEIRKEAEIEELTPSSLVHAPHLGTPSGFACPDCGSALWELSEGELIRFRCRVGHAWSANSLLAEQADVMESALWTALRALEERASLALHLAERMRSSSSIRLAEHFEDRAREGERSAEVIRELILHGFSADRSTLGALEARLAPEDGGGGQECAAHG